MLGTSRPRRGAGGRACCLRVCICSAGLVAERLEAAIAEAHGVLETERHSLERSAAELAFRITEAVLTRELALSSSPARGHQEALARRPKRAEPSSAEPGDVEASATHQKFTTRDDCRGPCRRCGDACSKWEPPLWTRESSLRSSGCAKSSTRRRKAHDRPHRGCPRPRRSGGASAPLRARRPDGRHVHRGGRDRTRDR